MSMCDICIPNTCWSIRWVLIRWWSAVQQILVRPQLRITTRTCSSFEETRVLPIFILENLCVSIDISLFATGLHNIRKPTKYKWVISTRPINGGNVTSVIALNPGNAATSPINVAQMEGLCEPCTNTWYGVAELRPPLFDSSASQPTADKPHSRAAVPKDRPSWTR